MGGDRWRRALGSGIAMPETPAQNAKISLAGVSSALSYPNHLAWIFGYPSNTISVSGMGLSGWPVAPANPASLAIA